VGVSVDQCGRGDRDGGDEGEEKARVGRRADMLPKAAVEEASSQAAAVWRSKVYTRPLTRSRLKGEGCFGVKDRQEARWKILSDWIAQNAGP